jgi:hypothetical protein
MVMIWTHVVYLAVSVSLTVWVGRTLFKNGRVFLVDAVAGDETLADSVNRLLHVGFYLVNIGFVCTALRYGGAVNDVQGAIEYLSLKLGVVLLALGGMHFLNLLLLSKWRRRAVRHLPPIEVTPVERRERHTLGGLRSVAVPLGDGDSRR